MDFSKMPDRPFTGRKVTDNTYVITGSGCDSYLLMGDECAIMIDSGMSKLNLKEFCQEFTDLPIIGVINTHGHLDHVQKTCLQATGIKAVCGVFHRPVHRNCLPNVARPLIDDICVIDHL